MAFLYVNDLSMNLQGLLQEETYSPLRAAEPMKSGKAGMTTRPETTWRLRQFPHFKLYHFVIALLVATTFTFGAEAAVGSPFSSRILDSEYDEPTQANPSTGSKDDLSSSRGDKVVATGEVPRSFTKRSSTEDAETEENIYDNIELESPEVKHFKHMTLKQSDEEELAKAIANDLFFADDEYNFYTSNWLTFFAHWTTESAPRYIDALKSYSTLTHAEFFAIDTLNWTKGMKCGIEYEAGCINLPTATDVRRLHPDDRHKARQIIYSLEALRKTHTDMRIFKVALTAATDRLVKFCREFSRTFFHEAVPPKKEMCIMEIINIILQVIMAIIDILTLGAALVVTVGPMVVNYAGTIALQIGNYLENVAIVGMNGVIGESLGLGSNAVRAIAESAAEGVGGAVASLESFSTITAGSEFTSEVITEGMTEAASIAGREGFAHAADETAEEAAEQAAWEAAQDAAEDAASDSAQRGSEEATTEEEEWWTYPPESNSSSDISWYEEPPELIPDSPGAEPPLPRPDWDPKWYKQIKDALEELREKYPVDYISEPSWRVPEVERFLSRTHAEYRKIYRHVKETVEIWLEGLPDDVRSEVSQISRDTNSVVSDVLRNDEVASIDRIFGTTDVLDSARMPKLSFMRRDSLSLNGLAKFTKPQALSVRPNGTRDSNQTVADNPFPDYACTASNNAPFHITRRTDLPTSKLVFSYKDYEILTEVVKSFVLDHLHEFKDPERRPVLREGLRFALNLQIPRSWQDKAGRNLWMTNPRAIAIGIEQYIENRQVLSQEKEHDNTKDHRTSPLPVSKSSSTYNVTSLSKKDIFVQNTGALSDRVVFMLHEKLNLQELADANDDSRVTGTGIYDLTSVDATHSWMVGLKRNNTVHGIELDNSSLIEPGTVTKMKRSSSTTHIAERKSPLFAIIRANDNQDHPAPPSRSILLDLQSHLYSRFRHDNGAGSYMNHSEIAKFLVKMGPRIAEHTVNLRKSIAEFPDQAHIPEDWSPAFSPPDFVVKTATYYTPWDTALGSMSFEGLEHRATGEQRQDPKMKFRYEPAQQHDLHVRANELHETAPVIDWKRRAIHAKHQMIGAADRLRGLGFIKPGGGHSKRDETSSGWKVHQDGFDFNIHVDDFHLRSIIDHVQCGQDGYKDSSRENEATCHELLDRIKISLINNIDDTLRSINHPDLLLKSWILSRPAPLAEHLRAQFSTYHNFISFRIPGRAHEYLEEKTFQNMKNSLVSKAWADQQCHLKCTSRGSCTSGCYDPTQHRIEGLYGLDESRHRMNGERKPWSLNKTLIEQISYEAYKAKSGVGYLPGAFDMNPYHSSTKDYTAVLPVCKTDYDSIFACNCGDMYGSEYDDFMRASDWRGQYKKYAYQTISECRDALRPLLGAHPAAYLLNACNYIYKGVAPWHEKSPQETSDKGHYKHNHCMCKGVWKYFAENKHRSDHDHNENICRIWSGASKDWTRGGIHSHQDISYINDDLQKHGCRNLRKTCKKGRCKDGYAWLNKYMERCWR